MPAIVWLTVCAFKYNLEKHTIPTKTNKAIFTEKTCSWLETGRATIVSAIIPPQSAEIDEVCRLIFQK